LTSNNDFNGELDGAILCVVEEKDISKSPGAAAKIREAVTALTLSIRKMRTDPYQVPNMTHWMQFSNPQGACSVLPGDTRITVIHVTKPPNEIGKDLLISRLKEEAPAFMRTMMDLTLPKVEGRLNLPLVETYHKARSEELARPLLDQFLKTHTHFVPGETIPFSDLFERFHDWLPREERHNWSKIKISRSLPVNHPSGSYTDNKTLVGNISWEPKEPKADAKLWIVKDGKLRKQS